MGVWIFDCSSNHKGFAADALNINNMNVNPSGRQSKMHSTIIPLDNPPPPPGAPDPHGQVQLMVYVDSDPNPDLCGKAKGMKAVLKEHGTIWDILCEKSPKGKPVGTCECCRKSQAAKDAEAEVAPAEAAGQEAEEDAVETLESVLTDLLPLSDWCCMSHVLSCVMVQPPFFPFLSLSVPCPISITF